MYEGVFGQLSHCPNNANNHTKSPSDPVYSKAFLWNLTYQLNPPGEQFTSLPKRQMHYECWR